MSPDFAHCVTCFWNIALFTRFNLHMGKKLEKMDKKLIKWVKKTGVSTLAIPAKVGQCRPCKVAGRQW